VKQTKLKLEWYPKQISKLMSHEEAVEYCKKLGKRWRLPNKIELINAYNNKIVGFEHDDYWSSTTYRLNCNDAWVVHFQYGYTYCYIKYGTARVRPIRTVLKSDIDNIEK
jgi:hypothetical protein